MQSLTTRQRLMWSRLQTNSRKAIKNKRTHYGGSLKGYFPRRELTLRLSKEFKISENEVYNDLMAIRQWYIG